ncbi:hypothetical protein QP519_10565 [Weeksella virosa]|uniref:hypothetical protein n=1 Tax=Weeksella virosa TaxID=1014 RepID=UPI0025567917|nr:hypothetical protein [Weeksella virosa]MDK7375976.1 hypothetical protein [Weeksella virosa]
MEAKLEILDTIKHIELSEIDKFNQLLSFYKKHSQKNRVLEAMLNRSGYSVATYKKLIYELQVLYKITDVELSDHILPKHSTNCNECLPRENDHTIVNKKKDKTQVEAKGNSKFRDEFSFLDDEDTPAELKILASDRISTYRQLQEKRKELENETLTNSQRAALTKEITQLDEENSLLWDELKHYQNKKEILGKHEIFLTYNLEKKVKLMSAPEILQRAETLKNQVRTAKMARGRAEKKNDTEKIEELNQKIKRLETEYRLIVKSIEKKSE